MRICFIAPADNYHVIKWATWFSKRGHEVHVVSFVDHPIDNVYVHYIDAGVKKDDSDTKKLKYLLKAGVVKKTVNSGASAKLERALSLESANKKTQACARYQQLARDTGLSATERNKVNAGLRRCQRK